MSLTPKQVEHKLRQHDQEILAIYDILADVRDKVHAHDTRFDQIDTTLTEVLRRLPENR